MSEQNWNKVAIFVLLLSIGIDVLALYTVIREQRIEHEEAQVEVQSNEATKEEIRQLHNELKLLKIQLEQIKK